MVSRKPHPLATGDRTHVRSTRRLACVSLTAPFTDVELSEFQASDIGAAKVIVLLMAGIFTAGLLLYTVVALVV